MPTSSIFQNIILTEKEEIEAFAKALEESEKYSEPIKDTDSRYITDPEELSELVDEMIKANCKWGLLKNIRGKNH